MSKGTTTQKVEASTYLLLASGMALFGSATPVSKIVGAAFPAFLASGFRMLTAALVLVPLVVVQRSGIISERRSVTRSAKALTDGISRSDWLLLFGVAAIGTFGFTLFLLYGLRLVPGTIGAIVMATTPAVTAIGATLFLNDRFGTWKALGIALAVLGVAVVNLGGGSSGSGGNAVLGSALVFGAVCCEGTYTLLGKRLGEGLSPLRIAALACLLAGALFVPLALWQAIGFDWSKPDGSDWIAVLWWGIGTMGLGSVLWFRGVMRVPGTTASAFMAVMPLSALMLSYVLLNEQFEWLHLGGLALVIGAIGAVMRGDAAKS